MIKSFFEYGYLVKGFSVHILLIIHLFLQVTQAHNSLKHTLKSVLHLSVLRREIISIQFKRYSHFIKVKERFS